LVSIVTAAAAGGGPIQLKPGGRGGAIAVKRVGGTFGGIETDHRGAQTMMTQFKSVIAAAARRRRAARDLAILSRESDRILRDIGITRESLRSAVMHGRID
jgi:uncharacterized protein YjiS (DUF1127 family)